MITGGYPPFSELETPMLVIRRGLGSGLGQGEPWSRVNASSEAWNYDLPRRGNKDPVAIAERDFRQIFWKPSETWKASWFFFT